MEHHSNIVPWQQLAERTGAELEWVPVDDDGLLDMEALAAALGREPKDLAKSLDRTGQVVALAGDIIRSKALDLLVEHADIRSDPGTEEPTRETEGSSDEVAATDQTVEETP
jgi:hypothetical protein